MFKKSEIIPKDKRCLEPCPDCPFGGPLVGAKGDPNSPFLIIGESPGKQEVEKGEPFVGPSGKLLDTSLAQGNTLGVKPYYINALQCWPGYADDKNSETLKLGAKACRQHVLNEIAKAPRKVILTLGAPALWSVTGDVEYKITQERGKLFPSESAVHVLATVHPAFLMRGGKGASHQQYMRDVKYAVDLFNGAPTKKPPAFDYIVARDERDVRDLAKYFRSFPKGKVIGADTETTGFSALSDRILCTGFAPEPDEQYVIPDRLNHVAGELYDNDCRFLWHNGKFDVQFQWSAGNSRARVDEDTMLMSYAIDEVGGIHDLETVSNDWLGSPNWKKVLDGYLKKGDTYEVIPRDVLYYYMSADIGNMLGDYYILREKIRSDPALERLYTRTLIPGSNFLARVERNGLYADVQRIQENDEWYKEQIKNFQQVFIDFSKPFPDSGYTEKLPNSWKQMQKLLYDDLKIKPYKGRRSTDKKVLEKLAPHPVLDALKVSRKVAKEWGTYVKSAHKNIDADGAVHTTYLLHGTKTGRLASKEPNLQNVPRNPRIRGQYVARPGRRFVEPDLNQAELRVLACLSNDPALCHIYETAGMSLHDEVRADIWGYPADYSPIQVREQLAKFGLTEDTRWGAKGEDRIIEEQKMRAKAVNFGIVYGRTAPSIAEEFSIVAAEAQGWIDKWFKKFSKAKEFLDKCRQVPDLCQVMVTPFGRKRRFGVVGRELLEGMKNEASNFPPQSSASDITLQSGIKLETHLKETYDADVCNLVHDSILIECPDDDVIAHRVAVDMCERLEAEPKLWGFKRIPFVAEAKMGYRWGSLSKYDHHKQLEAA